MNNVNVDKVFKEYGLDVQLVEPYVYKVLDTEKEISVEELQDSLVSSILITSDHMLYMYENFAAFKELWLVKRDWIYLANEIQYFADEINEKNA